MNRNILTTIPKSLGNIEEITKITHIITAAAEPEIIILELFIFYYLNRKF
ncbi:MAG: hypothetical protein QXL82_02045 [Candidatus Aenigmatarchaeota archaeon]